MVLALVIDFAPPGQGHEISVCNAIRDVEMNADPSRSVFKDQTGPVECLDDLPVHFERDVLGVVGVRQQLHVAGVAQDGWRGEGRTGGKKQDRNKRFHEMLL